MTSVGHTAPRHSIASNVAEGAGATAGRLNDNQASGGGRLRRVGFTVLAGVIGRPISMVCSFVTVGVLIQAYGTERYGMFVMLQNAIGILGFLDLGLQASLVNNLARYRSEKTQPAVNAMFSTAFVTSAAIGLAVLALGAILLGFTSCLDYLPVPQSFSQFELLPAVVLSLASLSLCLPLNAYDKPSIAFQEGWINVGAQLAGNVTLLILIAIGAFWHAGLAWCAASALGAMLATNGICAAVALRRYGAAFVPSLQAASFPALRQLFTAGRWFAIVTLINQLTIQCDPLISAVLAGFSESPDPSSMAAQVAVPARIFSLVTAGAMLAITPLWPAYAEATATGDHRWLKRTLWLSSLWSVGATATVGAVVIAIRGWLFDLWVGDAIHVPLSLLVAYSAWSVVITLSHTLGMFFTGAGHIHYQVVTGITFLVVSLPAKALGFMAYGPAGMIAATTAVMAVTQVVPFLWLAVQKTRGHGQSVGAVL